MKQVSQWLQDLSGLNPELQSKIFTSLFIILLLWLIRTIVIRIVWKKTEAVQQRYRWQKITTYIAVTLGFLLVGRVWFAGIQSLATFLGLVTAGLAIALQDVVKSFAGWGFILWRRPFVLGDRIQIGSHAGDVIDIRIFKFTMMEIGKGKKILQEIATRHAAHLSQAAEKRLKEASKRYMIFYKSLTPIVYTSVKDSGVMLTIRYLINPRRRRSSEQAIWEDILREFAKFDNIDFAYPTQRFYNNVLEGKEGARAKIYHE